MPIRIQRLIRRYSLTTSINRPSNHVAQWECLRSRRALEQASGERVFGLGPPAMAENDDVIIRPPGHQRKGDEGGAQQTDSRG
jgi:hypothetical protein